MMKFRWAVATAILAITAGCTTPNPRSCIDGSCTDPAFPYCDADGSLAGQEKTCIAVDCTPGEFVACRADDSLVCSPAGGDYDLEQCAHGCQATAGGCRLCEPNETACTNGKLATCDSNGGITASETCALGCFEDQARCVEMVPANNLGQFLTMVPSPSDFELTNARIQTYSGAVTVGTQNVDIPSFVASGAGNGPAVRVFVVRSITLHGAQILGGGTSSQPTYAVAFVATDTIRVDGQVDVNGGAGGATVGCGPAMKGHANYNTSTRVFSTGGGGGGNATRGGNGGSIDGGTAPAGDPVSGTASLVPLRGGCSGAVEFATNNYDYPTGGGAIQLSAKKSIEIDGVIDVRGTEGQSDIFDQSLTAWTIGGGGAGGSVLIDAPQVVLAPGTRLDARGGMGFAACQLPSAYCTVAGNGATATQPAQDAAAIPNTTAGSNLAFQTGGGGGGLGRVRINTRDGSYTKASSVIEEAAVTTGVVQSR